MDADTVLECLECHSIFPASYEAGLLVLRPSCPSCLAFNAWYIGPPLLWTEWDRGFLQILNILPD